MTWLVPGALAGLALVVVPILVHLLVRERGRPRPFPSLRFLRESRMASIARRALGDWPLLAVRCLVIAAATAAVAGPVWTGAGRQAAWAGRVARAVVTAGDAGDALARDEAQGAYASTVIRRPVLADGLAAAAHWLEGQPPAAREVVVVAPLVRGDLDAADLAAVPGWVGLRFVRAPRPTTTAAAADVLRLEGGRQAIVPLELSLDDEGTAVTAGAPVPLAAPIVEVEAAEAQRDAAESTLAAVLAEGTRLPLDGRRRILVSWGGPSMPDGVDVRAAWMRRAVAALPGASAREEDGRLVVGLPGDPGDVGAARRLATLLDEAFADDLSPLEPAAIPDQTLAAWTRPPGEPPGGAAPVDEGDRRWPWLAALALLGLEQWMRRPRPAAPAGVAGEVVDRVA
ncbi:MAG: BatA domain-containing protein [Vicinamibacterales bacterium]